MKKNLLALIPLAAIFMLAMRTANDSLPIGSPIPHPEKKMEEISGKQVSFKESMKKNGLLVMFTCNTCPVVAKYRSRTLDLAGYAAKKDIGVILLNSNEGTRDDGESFSDMKSYASEQGYKFSYVLDKNSEMADAFGAQRTPEIYLFDKDAKLVYTGAIDDNINSPEEVTRKHAQLAIDELTNGKDVTIKQTRSVGCGIKRAE